MTKTLLISGLFSGLTYAVIMMGFDYYDGKELSILKFIVHALIFGGLMALATRYNLKKKQKQDNQS